MRNAHPYRADMILGFVLTIINIILSRLSYVRLLEWMNAVRYWSATFNLV